MATTEQLINRLTNAHIPKLPPATPEHEVWVSPAIRAWGLAYPQAAMFADDVTVDGTPYRRLTPQWFAWMYTAMCGAKRRYQSGKVAELDYARWMRMREAWRPIQGWAKARYGEPALLEAVDALSPGYKPPIPWDKTIGAQWREPSAGQHPDQHPDHGLVNAHNVALASGKTMRVTTMTPPSHASNANPVVSPAMTSSNDNQMVLF